MGELFVIRPLLLLPLLIVIGAYVLPTPSDHRVAVDVDDAEAEDAIRFSGLGTSGEMVNASDVQELRERTNANVSHNLSNTSLADLENDNLTQLLQIKYRERKRQERLMVIQTQILQRLHMSRQPNISATVFSQQEQQRINDIVEKIRHINNHNGDDESEAHNHNNKNNNLPINHLNDGTTIDRLHQMHTTTMQRLQSFYPSCSLPNNTDKSTWERPNKLRIYYDVPANRYNSRSQVTVLLAKFRLFKIATPDESRIRFDAMQRLNTLDAHNDDRALFSRSSSSNIYITVYQYMRPLRFNKKERKRVVETKSVASNYEGWVEFNVASSLNFWLHHSHRNYGFDIEVVNANGHKLNPNHLFQIMNCSSSEVQDSPFPNIMELHPDMMNDNETSLFDNETYPTLDLQTADISTLDSAIFHVYQPASYTNANRRIMKKRHISNRTVEKQSLVQCENEVTYISFAELGLDDVILYPEGFHWTFCTGACQYSLKHDSEMTNEALTEKKNMYQSIRALLNYILKQSSRRRKAECKTVGRRPLHITYVDDAGNIDSSTLSDFVPTRCSCTKS